MSEPAADERLRRATLRVLTASGRLAGTAFSVATDGRLMTCHHVVAGDSVFELDDSEGTRWRGRRCSGDESLHRSDLAIVQLEACDRPFPPPLPLLAVAEEALSVRSRAWLGDSDSFRDTIALRGHLRGPSRIAYRAQGNYSVVGQAIGGFVVEPGMSGAALWSDRFEAVIGVLAVSAEDARNVSGFGILLAEAADSPELAALIEANAGATARGGALPNEIGLRRLLGSASAATLRRLEDRQIVLPSKFVPRAGARDALDAFIASDCVVFPIVSVAAHGKTSLMAHLTSDESLPPTWLVRGADLERGEPEAALNRLLGQAGLAEPVSFTRLASQCGCRPLLLLDGLNEVPMTQVEMAREWLPDLISCVRQAGWKLVFTTRPELFAFLRELRPHFFEPPSADGARSHFILGEYSAAEATEAVRTYEVKKGISRNIGRHPMMVRLAHEAGADADRRSRVLQRFLDKLLLGIRGATALHPAGIVRHLVALAGRAEAGSGIFAFDDDLVRGQEELVAALVRENILEEVAGGYRFVFDEIRDYLLAVGLASSINGPGDIPDLERISYPPDVIAVCLELLDDGPDRATARAWATKIGSTLGAKAERRRAFAIIAALPRTPDFDEIKRGHVDALIAGEGGDSFIDRERDLSVAFPPDAFDRLLERAIEQEDGYGWREKDIWSNWHRGGTEASARMKFGPARLVIELLDNEERDGAEVLIRLLDDATPLQGREARVGSFALCMLLAHRQRIGLARIFDQVVLGERPGADSLVMALAEEEPAILTDLLEAVPVEAQVEHFLTIRDCWRSLLDAEATQGNARLRERAAAALDSLADHLPEVALQEVLLLAVSRQVPVRIDAPAAIERIGIAGDLHHSLLVSAVQAGWLALDAALEQARRWGIERDFVWTQVGVWTPAARVALAEVVRLAEERLRSAAEDRDAAFPLESLARRAGLAEAKSSGLTALFERIVREQREVILQMLVYATGGQDEEGEVRALSQWLLDLLLGSDLSPDMRRTMLSVLAKEPGRIGRNRSRIGRLSRGIAGEFIVHLMGMNSYDKLREDHELMVEAILETGDPGEADRQMLTKAAKILGDRSLSGLERMDALLDLIEP